MSEKKFIEELESAQIDYLAALSTVKATVRSMENG